MGYDRLASVTLQQLRCLAAVGRERNFARAAEALLVSQPAISAQIRSLEAIVGVRLIERTPGRRHLQFTEAGRLMLAAAEEMVQVLERTGDTIDRLRGDLRGTVSLGASLFFGGYVFPPLLASFRRCTRALACNSRSIIRPTSLNGCARATST